MKQWKTILITILIFLFSFYYTNKSIEFVRNVDPIMKSIKDNIERFEKKPVDAVINQNTITPGLKGTEVDISKTYQKMKRYGAYNESLITLKEAKPKVTIKDHYEKYIIQGNPLKKSVSLVFIIENVGDFEIISNYLKLEHLKATLFLKESLLESMDDLSDNPNEIELLYDSNNPKKESKEYMESLISKKTKYCVSNNENNKLLEYCKKNKLHTIIPSIVLEKEPTRVVKENLRNGLIIGVTLTPQVRNELDYIIMYMKSKGYSVRTLGELLEE